MRRGILQLGLFVGLLGLCLGRGTPAQATILVQTNTPFSLPVIDACTGEVVDVSGVSHTVVEFTNNGSGGGVFGLHSNEHDVSGVGETSFTTYHGQSVTQDAEFNGPLPITFTTVVNIV